MATRIVMGVIIGATLGILAGSAALQLAATPTLAMQANKSSPVLELAPIRSWDI
jgi:galactitol-specific phosphotransferase system IIC component